jgi:hypothetical protein
VSSTTVRHPARLGWLTERRLLDAVAATLGIFLPAFAFVALSGPLVPRIRRSPVASAPLFVRWRVGSAWLVLCGAGIGLAATWVRHV